MTYNEAVQAKEARDRRDDRWQIIGTIVYVILVLAGLLYVTNIGG